MNVNFIQQAINSGNDKASSFFQKISYSQWTVDQKVDFLLAFFSLNPLDLQNLNLNSQLNFNELFESILNEGKLMNLLLGIIEKRNNLFYKTYFSQEVLLNEIYTFDKVLQTILLTKENIAKAIEYDQKNSIDRFDNINLITKLVTNCSINEEKRNKLFQTKQFQFQEEIQRSIKQNKEDLETLLINKQLTAQRLYVLDESDPSLIEQLSIKRLVKEGEIIESYLDENNIKNLQNSEQKINQKNEQEIDDSWKTSGSIQTRCSGITELDYFELSELMDDINQEISNKKACVDISNMNNKKNFIDLKSLTDTIGTEAIQIRETALKEGQITQQNLKYANNLYSIYKAMINPNFTKEAGYAGLLDIINEKKLDANSISKEQLKTFQIEIISRLLNLLNSQEFDNFIATKCSQAIKDKFQGSQFLSNKLNLDIYKIKKLLMNYLQNHEDLNPVDCLILKDIISNHVKKGKNFIATDFENTDLNFAISEHFGQEDKKFYKYSKIDIILSKFNEMMSVLNILGGREFVQQFDLTDYSYSLTYLKQVKLLANVNVNDRKTITQKSLLKYNGYNNDAQKLRIHEQLELAESEVIIIPEKTTYFNEISKQIMTQKQKLTNSISSISQQIAGKTQYVQQGFGGVLDYFGYNSEQIDKFTNEQKQNIQLQEQKSENENNQKQININNNEQKK